MICDKAAIPTLIKTAQMVGLVIGAAVNGQLGEKVFQKELSYMDLFYELEF